MNTASTPHLIDCINDVNGNCVVHKSVHCDCAKTVKCNSLTRSESKSLRFYQKFYKSFDFYDDRARIQQQQRKKGEKVLVKGYSDAVDTAATMQRYASNRSVNRNGTIARNTFRGVPGNVLERQTKRFLQSMTVSINLPLFI